MNISMNGTLARPLALATALIVTGCGGGSTDTAAPAVPARDLAGAVTKGPLDGAVVKIQGQAGGVATGPVLATATTDTAGRFTVPQFSPPAGASVLIVQACGGSYVDESDTGSPRRSILLTSTDCLEAPLAVGAGSAVVTPYTAALLAKARNQFDGQGTYSFEQVFAAVQAQATQAFGFDPFTILPANPLAPTGTPAQIQYAMLLGGAAQAINAVAVSSGRLPQFSDVQAFVTDFSDGRLDAVSLAAETRRFQGNNAAMYSGTAMPQVDEAALTLAAPMQTAPVAEAQSLTLLEDAAATPIVLSGTDLEGDTLTFAITSQPTRGSLSFSNGVPSYLPFANEFGTDSFTFTASDGARTSAPATVTLTITPVNDPPVALFDAASTVEDTPLAIPTATLTFNDVDVDGGTLTITDVGNASNGLVTLSAGTVTFTPGTEFSGSATFNYTLSDGQGGTAVGLVTVTVTAANDAPVISDFAGGSIPEDGSTGSIDYTIGDAETPAAALTFTATSSDAALVPPGGISYVDDGDGDAEFRDLTITPALNANGSTTITVTVTDAAGATATDAFTLIVTPQNDPPVANNDAFTVAEGGTSSVLTLGATTVIANDSDPDSGDTLVVTLLTPPANAAPGLFTLNPEGTFTYTHDGSSTTSDSFTYQVTDSGGLTSTATVSIGVTAVADAPEAFDDSYSVDEDATLEVAAPGVLGNDVDEDLETLTATIVSGGAYATSTSVAFGGAITYIPEADFNGEDSFTYTATDGTLTSNTATVTITVNPVPDAPVALDDAYTVANGGSLTTTAGIDGLLDGVAPDFAGRDYDVDGDELGIVVLATPSHAASFGPIQDDVTFAFTGGFTYTHDGSATLSDSFTYKVCDVPAPPLASLCSGPATVTLTIEAGSLSNDPFAGAIALFPGQPVSGDSTGATLEPGEPGSCIIFGGSMWYSWTPSNSGTGIFETRGSFLDTVLEVFTGPDLASLTSVGCNDDADAVGITGWSVVSVPVTAGTTYWVRVAGTAGVTGLFTIRADFDSDADGLSDSLEGELGTNPNDADSDDDSYSDYEEVSADGDRYNSTLGDSDPIDAGSIPGGGGPAPVAVNDSFVVGQGSALLLTDLAGVLANDTPYGGTASLLSPSYPLYAANFSLEPGGGLYYAHADDAAYAASGDFADSFLYEVCAEGFCSTALATIYIHQAGASADGLGGNWEFFTFEGDGQNGAGSRLFLKSSLSFLPGGVYLYGASLQLSGLDDSGCDSFDALSSDVGPVVNGEQLVAGIEYGPYDWDPATANFGISQAPIKETDGYCGFSQGPNVGNDIVSLVLSPFDNLITFIHADHTVAQWTRTVSPTGELKGAFLVDGTLTSGDPKVFTFRPDAGGATGHYLMVDANANENAAESPGIEYGCYSITQDANLYWLTSTTAAGTPACGEGIDKNLDAGISGLTLADQAKFTVSGDDATFANAAGPVGTLSRLPITADSGAAPPAASELHGTWEVESHPGMFITFLADGTYIKGGPELDSGCGGAGNEADGNGYEQGTWSVTGSTLTTTVSVETDGDCGLGAGATSIAVEAAGQTLVLDATTNDPAYLHKVASGSTGSLVGAWYFAGADFANPEAIGATPLLFVFKADGTYTMIDTTADPLCDPADGALGGVERGLYSHASGQLSVSELSVDTNGDCGLSDFIGVATPGTVVFHGTDPDRIQITQGADVAVLKRLSMFNDVDRDGDGVVAAHEARLGLSDTNADFDADGLKDGAELAAGAQPNDPDSDDDGFGDGFEIADGSNPAQALSKPAAAPANDFFAVSTSAAVGTVIPAPGVLLNDNRTYGSGLQAFEVAGSTFFQILPSGAVQMNSSATAGDYTLSYQPKQSSGLPVGATVTVRIHVSAATAATPPGFWYLPYHVDTAQGGGDYIVRSDDFTLAGRGTVVPRAGTGPALGYGTRLLSKAYLNGDTSIGSFLPDALVYARDGSLHWAGLRDIDSPSVPKRFTDESGAYPAALCDGDDSPFVTPLEFSGTGSREALYFYTLRDGAGDCTVHRAANTGAGTSTPPTTLPGRVLSPIIDSDAVATVRGFVTLVPSTTAGFEETVDVRVYGPDFTTPLFNSLLGSNAGTTSVEVHTDLGHVLFETFAASSSEHYLRKLQVDLAPFSVGAQYSLFDLGTFKVEEVLVDGNQSSGHFYVLITQQEPSIQSKVLKIPRSATGTGSYEVYATPLGSYVERILLTNTYVVFNEKLSPESTAVLKVYPKAGGDVLNMDFTQSGSFFATPTHVFWTTYDGLSHQARYAAEAPVGGLETPFVDLGANTQFIGEVFEDSGTLGGQNLGESSSHVFMVDDFLGPGLGFSPSSLYALSTTPPIAAPALIGTFDGQLDADRYAYIGLDRPGIGLAPACRYDGPVECDLYALDVDAGRFTRITDTTALDEGTIDDDEVEVDNN